ncbi:MFS transporter [Actibacterium pelagium]|uniref:MFS transporter n=1 Tax=Actibacterium pelagium TaxID=2029103 RepID=A0A917AHF9_9RHOB|nr:MFS transporter [Actibacterium pelagium]GGE52191.1 MFS transporter [Actibacterium pelagium]
MATEAEKKRIWGWYAFDWASQPYNTLLLTFIFGPYIKELMGDGARAQAIWGYGIGATGIVIAVLAPLLGAIADQSGSRRRFIWLFSLLYVVGAYGLWWTAPGDFNVFTTMLLFAIGLIGMEFATIFTNAMLPDLGPKEKLGRISGTGWAVGYLGGLVTLVLMLVLLAENATTGKTLIGIDPIFGLDASAREGTRAVGPLSAIWYAVFMIPFFLWVKETPKPNAKPIRRAISDGKAELMASLSLLPKQRSLFAYLGSSMFYRDALNGFYVFGGIYAAGVLGWSVIEVGIFGIIAVVSGALFAWLGGRMDDRFGPKRVIFVSILVLLGLAVAAFYTSRTEVMGLQVGPDSRLPDLTFYAIGALIGGAGGTLQSASRTMMVRQANGGRMTEAFGLYALAGKASSFLAPLLIGLFTDLSGSQQFGVLPIILLFLIGLILLIWVKPDGERADTWSVIPSSPSS